MPKFSLINYKNSGKDLFDLGIDLGTSNTLIYIKGKGIVLNEPSIIAVKYGTKKIVAAGTEAEKILLENPDNITAIRPIRGGVIADIESAEKMLCYFLSRALPDYRIIRPRMVICVPSCNTEVEWRAVEEIADKTGAREVHLIYESLAAAIGADIPIEEPAGHMICDIGGGVTEISVITLGDMVLTNAIRLGGDEFDQAILKHVHNAHNLIIGEQAAERIKMEIGNALPVKNITKMEVKGNDAITGLPRRLEIDSAEINGALKESVTQIVDEIKVILGKTPPELAADIVERGIVMTGNGSLLEGLDKLIAKESGVPTIISEQPGNFAVIGAGNYFDYLKAFNYDRA